ncbi:MAG: AAA family ATPase [Candidatus Diapherotrites archaeon]|nr:AAA family ATPase [Candidatus Diapherotrites archaeon]
MRILITGTPGVGKTTIAARLAKILKYRVVSEKEFCEQHRIGRYNPRIREREVPLSRLKTELSAFLKKTDNVIVEGHLSCECRLRPIDAVIVVRLDPDRLEFRLRERGYPDVKVLDNVMVEGIDYCKNHAVRNYGIKRVHEAVNNKELKHTLSIIVQKLSVFGSKK